MRYTTFELRKYVKGSQVDRSNVVCKYEHVDANKRYTADIDVKHENLASVMLSATWYADVLMCNVACKFFAESFDAHNMPHVLDDVHADVSHVLRMHEIDESDTVRKIDGTVSVYRDNDLFGSVYARKVAEVQRRKNNGAPRTVAIVVEFAMRGSNEVQTYTVKCDKYGRVQLRTWGFAAVYNQLVKTPLARYAERLSMNFRKKHGTSATYKFRLESVANGIATSGTAK